MKPNKLKRFIAKVTGKKQHKYVDLSRFVADTKPIVDHLSRIYLDTSELASARRRSKGFGQIYRFKDRETEFYNSNRFWFYDLKEMSEKNPYMIDFGYFPQSIIDSWEVEELMNPRPTGRSYSKENYIDFIGNYCPEFRLENGKRIVRCGNKNSKKNLYSEVEPISWIIENGENIFKEKFDSMDSNWGLNSDDLFHNRVESMQLRLPSVDDMEEVFSAYINLKQALVVAPELLKLSGVKNIDELIERSEQDECEKVL